MSFDLPPQRKLTLNKMALGVLQPRTGQTIGVRTLVFLYSYLYGGTIECDLYCSKLFGLTHACGTNMAANDGQKTVVATDDRRCKGDFLRTI